MKCPECDAEIIYLDRWFKKCKNGHVSPTLRSEFEEWQRKAKQETAG
jgi:hypothetical protein